MEKRGEEVHVNMEEARAGSTPHVVRYVLMFGLALAIIALSVIWISGALTDKNPEGGGNESAPAAQSDKAY